MQASESKLGMIIEGTKQYVVPIFQRRYSWKEPQWQELWDDLIDLCESQHDRPHFMGSIVTMPANSAPEAVTKYLLIDGQQRLTTIFILLAVLRDYAEEMTQRDLKAEIHNTLLVNQYKKGDDIYKLQPTQSDRQPFREIIDKQQFSHSSYLNSCYKFFERQLRQSKIDLEKIKTVIEHRLSLVSISLGKDDDPYLVFESLNAKGQPLTQADLVRNYFFMRISKDEDRQEKVYRQYWHKMEELLSDKLPDYIRDYLTKDGQEIKKNQVYFELKERLLDLEEQKILDSLKDLFKFAQYYSQILEPNRESDTKVAKYIERLNRLELTVHYPFLLKCYEAWENHTLTRDDFVEVLQVLENFLIRRFVCGIQSNSLGKIFAPLYIQIENSSRSSKNSFVQELKLNLQGHKYPEDGEFREKLQEKDFYKNNQQKTKLILESLEEYINPKERIDCQQLSLEHVMPRKLSDWWKDYLGKNVETTHALYLNCLGNLTLTGYNSELSNTDYLAKREHFSKSNLSLNRYFEKIENWQREDIERRSDYLADIALKIWHYFGDKPVKTAKGREITKPRNLEIFGKRYLVKYWRDVLEITMNEIAHLYPDRFNEIIDRFPRFIGQDQEKFRSTRILKNGLFIEVNLSGKDIQKICVQSIDLIGLPAEMWAVETED